MWASEQARNNAIRAMLARSSTSKLWTAEGPTKEAHELLRVDGGYLSSGERVLLKAAFDLWNGQGHCRVDELLSTLDEEHLAAVARAIMARDIR